MGQAKYEIEAIKLPDDLVKQATAAIEEAKAAPNKDRLSTAVSVLKKVQQAATSIEGAAGSAVKIGAALTTLASIIG